MALPTLESILELKSKHLLYHDFILYLQHSYCLENLFFYQDIQEYRSKPTIKKYQDIITRYILVNSAQEINIPCDMRQALISTQQVDKFTFDVAAEAILELIRVNSFLPWLYQRTNHSNRRNTLTPSLSVPEHRWQHMFTSRPSFASLRDVDLCGQEKKSKKLTGGRNLFQRKGQALIFRVKQTGVNGFSWLAKK